MSDTYDIEGVTITPQPGGYYLLAHPSLQEPDRIRGKENADARAKEIAAAAGKAPGEGHIETAPVDPAALKAIDPSTIEQPGPEAAPPPPADPRDAQIDALLKASEAQQKMIDALLKQKPTTVVTDDGAAPTIDPLRVVPQQFSGPLDDDTKKVLKKAGVTYTRIILEEHSDIPPTGLFLGHNGRSYVIQPGVEVDVPDFLLGVLDDAVMSAPVIDEKTRKVLGYRERRKYNYRKV